MKNDVLRTMGLALIVALALVGVLNQQAVAATSCTYNQSSGTGATLFATSGAESWLNICLKLSTIGTTYTATRAVTT